MKALYAKAVAVVTTAAREELLPRFASVSRQHKSDGSLITEADLAMQERILGSLHDLEPGFAFLGEEMSESEQTQAMQNDRPLWCLDPLDGTSNFANGIPYFSVSLALIQDDKVVFGVVYDPVRDECFTAVDQQAATLNNQHLSLQSTGLTLKDCTAIVDLKRLHESLAIRLATQSPYGSQRSFGSVALDWCWMAAGRGQLYLHGKQRIWDYAAGHFIFQTAGGYSATLENDPLYEYSLAPRAAVAACDESLFNAWKSWIHAK